jgi:hypothetical protein
MSKTLFKLSGPAGATFEVVDNAGTCEIHSGGTKVVGAQGDAITGLTDNSGGTAADTIAAIGATYSQAEVQNAVASLAAKIEEILTALETQGTIAS